MDITPREKDILTTIIDNYIHSADPVGSRTVAKQCGLGLSPASIRNTMSDLTDKGYLEQPHTSAGRTPTPKAFRFYVDHVVHMQPLTDRMRTEIVNYLSDEDLEIPEILKRASKLVSSLSHQVSLVLAPKQELGRWRQIDFVLIKPGLVMSLLIIESGLVQNKVIQVDPDISTDDLIKFKNYLNELFQGRTLRQVRNHLIQEIQQAKKTFNALYQKAIMLARKTFQDDSREIFVEGTSTIFDKPDFGDLSTMRELFTVIEERSKLLDLLDKSMKEQGIRVLFGEENQLEDLPFCSVISSPYRGQEENLGAVGIIGPMRMNYAKMVPVVDFTAQVLTSILKNRLQ